uniref:Uncharacterized protein n=1 Tax=Timema cristinae TaxID=61476 RepID=A0A7R9H487_TIMCR|nr:unnamed protein product [Timema cristinae]
MWFSLLTSTQEDGFHYQTGALKRVIRRPPPHLQIRDIKVFEDNYKTSTGLTHNFKERTQDIVYGGLPMNNKTTIYLRNLQEKINCCLFKPLDFPLSSYTDEYPPKHVNPSLGRVGPGLDANCQSRGLGRDEQPVILPQVGSIVRLMDPYISTTHLVHTPFSAQQLSGVAKKDAITFYNAEGSSIKKGPVYDERVFTTKATNRTVPNLVPKVPHKGMKTEHQAQYHLPLDDFYHCRWYAGVEGFPAIPRASPWENLSSPNMYCTEYCHLGTGWPVRAVVDPGAT